MNHVACHYKPKLFILSVCKNNTHIRILCCCARGTIAIHPLCDVSKYCSLTRLVNDRLFDRIVKYSTSPIPSYQHNLEF